MTDSDFMHLALDACRRGVESGQSPFGACIVINGEVVACEHNRVWDHKDPTAHAEVEAIRAACKKLGRVHLNDAVIYSTTEPCPMCFTAIHWARIPRIVYAATVEDAMSFGFNELQISNQAMKSVSGSDIAITPHLLRDEALAVYQSWKDRKGHRTY